MDGIPKVNVLQKKLVGEEKKKLKLRRWMMNQNQLVMNFGMVLKKELKKGL